MRDKSDVEMPFSWSLYNDAKVAIKADRPEADEARPAAVGKLFSDAM